MQKKSKSSLTIFVACTVISLAAGIVYGEWNLLCRNLDAAIQKASWDRMSDLVSNTARDSAQEAQAQEKFKGYKESVKRGELLEMQSQMRFHGGEWPE